MDQRESRRMEMNFSGLYEMQGMLFLLIMAGMVLKRKGIITGAGKSMLADLVIYVTLPCSTLKSFEMEFGPEILKTMGAAFGISCLIQAACYGMNHFLYRGVEERKKKVLLYATMTSNAGILGNSIAEGIFGTAGLFYGSIYLIPQRTVMWSLGMTYFTEAPDKLTLAKKVMTHPCILAVFAGFILMAGQISLPGVIDAAVGSLGNANTAVSMLFIGAVLGDARGKGMVTKTTCCYSLVRLILIPALVFAGCALAGTDAVVMGVCVVLSGMPAASVTAILASKYGGDEQFDTSCVVFSTLLSMLTVPLWCMALSLV